LKLLASRRAGDMVAILLDHGFLTDLLGTAAEIGRFGRVAGETRDPVDRLAALAVMTSEGADALRERLRLSREEHERLASYAGLVAEMKSPQHPLDAVAIRRLVAKRGVAPVVLAARALAGEPRPDFAEDALPALEDYRSGARPIPVFPLRGADLVREGLPKGPHIGEILADARHTWFAEGCPEGEAYADDLKERVLASLGGR
jgi:poly(A) polymerase